MSAATSCSGSAGGFLQNTVFGSRVSWYAETCGSPKRRASSRSARAIAGVCPGSAYMRSMLMLSKLASAASMAPRAHAGEQRVDRLRREQARGAATDEDADDTAPPNLG